jgi:hypothetical protein
MGFACAEPKMLSAVEMSGLVQTAAYSRLPSMLGYMSRSVPVRGTGVCFEIATKKPGSMGMHEGL